MRRKRRPRQLDLFEYQKPIEVSADEVPSALVEAVRAEMKQHRFFAKLEVEVELRRWRTVRVEVKVHDGRLRLQLSEAFRAADAVTLAAATRIMLRKLRGRPVLSSDHAVFNRFAHSRQARALLPAPRRKPRYRPQGRFFDLAELFDAVNQRYLGGALRQPTLGWSRHFYRRLGAYYPDEDLILLNHRLDSPLTPRLVVEFVLYHEMLHKKHGARGEGAARRYHTREFRREERQFQGWQEAEQWCNEITW